VAIQARDDKDLCMSLMAKTTWSEVPSTTLVSFLVFVFFFFCSYKKNPARAAVNTVIPKSIRVISLLSLWEVVPDVVSIPLSFQMAA
jgi:hypothetical protein